MKNIQEKKYMNLKINKKIKLGKKIISENSEPYLIAEISCNHNGSINNAKNLIKLAKKSNADAVKFQTHIANSESTEFDKFRIKSKYVLDKNRLEYWQRTSFTKLFFHNFLATKVLLLYL